MSEDAAPVVLAAGGVVHRRTDTGQPRILLVHRPRYDDWSLPKGKAEAGEDLEHTALREVQEETGLRCRLGPDVGRTRYRDSRGRAKEVRYWLMDPLDDDATFVANHEVDEIRWCSAGEAATLLSYDHDRRLIASVGEEFL